MKEDSDEDDADVGAGRLMAAGVGELERGRQAELVLVSSANPVAPAALVTMVVSSPHEAG